MRCSVLLHSSGIRFSPTIQELDCIAWLLRRSRGSRSVSGNDREQNSTRKKTYSRTLGPRELISRTGRRFAANARRPEGRHDPKPHQPDQDQDLLLDWCVARTSLRERRSNYLCALLISTLSRSEQNRNFSRDCTLSLLNMVVVMAMLHALIAASPGELVVTFPPGQEERFTVAIGDDTWFANEPVWFQVNLPPQTVKRPLNALQLVMITTCTLMNQGTTPILISHAFAKHLRLTEWCTRPSPPRARRKRRL